MPVKKKVKKEKKVVKKDTNKLELFDGPDGWNNPIEEHVEDALTYLQYNTDLMKVDMKDISKIFHKQKAVETEVFVPIKLWSNYDKHSNRENEIKCFERLIFHCHSEWIFKYPFTICTVTIEPADNYGCGLHVQLVSGVGIARKSDKDKLNHVEGLNRSFGRAVSALTAKLNLKPIQHHYKG